MYFLGIDPSLTNTGITILHEDRTPIFSTTISNTLSGINRLLLIKEGVKTILRDSVYTGSFFLASIEGPSLASRTSSLFELGELSGILQGLLVEYDVSYIMPSPSEVKKVFSGKGNAGKGEMKKTAEEKYKRLTDGYTEHEIDALACAYFGSHFYKQCGEPSGLPEVENFIKKIMLKEKWIERPKEWKGKVINPKYYLNVVLLRSIALTRKLSK